MFILSEAALPVDAKVQLRSEGNLQQVFVLLLFNRLINPVLNRGVSLQMLLLVLLGCFAQGPVVQLLSRRLDEIDVPVPDFVVFLKLLQHVALPLQVVVD